MRVLVTGGAGQVGMAVAAAATYRGWDVVACDRHSLDIADPGCADRIADLAPEVIVNAAAFTDVDRCETEPDMAFAVNTEGAANVARGAAICSARLVHYSTDYVFDGLASAPYLETSPPSPLQVYGRSKLAGERAVAATHGAGSWIVRTSWVFSAGGRNFVPSILRRARSGSSLQLVHDQVGSPTYANDLAEATLELIGRCVPGLYHLVGGGEPASRLSLGLAVLAEAGIDVAATPVSASTFGAVAVRPAYSALGTHHRDAPSLPDWRDAVRRCVAGDHPGGEA